MSNLYLEYTMAKKAAKKTAQKKAVKRRVERREDRQEQQQSRLQARRQLMRIASEVYQEGDDIETLKSRIAAKAATDFEKDRPFLKVLLSLLETFGPAILKALLGI